MVVDHVKIRNFRNFPQILNVPRRTEESGSERNGLGGEAPLCHL
jgi:hypothetical protein